MRSSVLISAISHLLVLLALFWARSVTTVTVPGPEAVQVQLVDLGQIQSPPRPVETAPQDVPDVKVKPEANETGVKLVPPPKKQKKVERATAPTAEPAPPQLPSAPAGSAGLRGDVSVDAANFEFTYYLLVIRNRIAAAWAPPAGLASGGQAIRSVVFFRIDRSGQITEIRLEQGSSVEFFDQSAIRAVTIANPMPPLPLGFGGPDLGVHFGFDYGG